MKSKILRLNNQSRTLLLILLGIFIYNILNGLTLTFTDLKQESLKSRFSEVHFSSSGNDFGGGVFWLATKSLNTPITIQFVGGGESKKCYKQIRGIYYNSARGARLWPLDQDTLALLSGSGIGYSNLSMNGGLYTSCEGDSNKYGIFGYISYNWAGTTSILIGGTKLNYSTNSYIPSFTNNFQYFNNTTPLGYFWDSVGGIGFVGGYLTGDENLINYLNSTGSINDSFSLGSNNSVITNTGNRSLVSGSGNAQDTMWNILVQGNVILSKAIDIYERKAFLGNLEKRTILLNGADLNSATVINSAKKNAEILCRGKIYFVGPVPTTLPINNTDNVLCYKNVNLSIDLVNDVSKYTNKTIVMKNGNVTLSQSMKNNSPSLDIFVDGGNLYINNPSHVYENFNNQGFPTTTSAVTSGIFLRGNFIINGLLIGGTPTNESVISNKLHLQGKIATLNTPTNPAEGRKQQILKLFPTDFSSWISLENIFTWECGLDGIASDGSSCTGDNSISLTPFVVLNGNYPSLLLK